MFNNEYLCKETDLYERVSKVSSIASTYPETLPPFRRRRRLERVVLKECVYWTERRQFFIEIFPIFILHNTFIEYIIYFIQIHTIRILFTFLCNRCACCFTCIKLKLNISHFGLLTEYLPKTLLNMVSKFIFIKS